VPVQETSRKAYHELKEEGKITPRQDVAFKNIREFYEEKGYWPTPKEVHTFLALEKADAIAQFEGPNYVKPRITEMIVGNGDEDDPDLLEKEDARDQDYIEDVLSGRRHDYEAKQANPVKIRDYQSTLSEEEGEAAEIEKRKDDGGSERASEQVDEEPDEVEIPYEVEGGDEIRMGSPEEAIIETTDLASVKQLLESKAILEDYQDEIAEREDECAGTESDGDQDSGSEDMDTVEVDGEEYLLDPREEPEEEEESDSGEESEEAEESEEESEQEVFMRDGEVVV